MKKNGYTITELLIVVMIAILAGLFIARILQVITNQHRYSSPVSHSTAAQSPQVDPEQDYYPASLIVNDHDYIHSPNCKNGSCNYNP